MAASTLPMEIIATEILPKLPAISLLCFKCVCKFFQTLISSSEFVHCHLRRSLSSNDSRLLILVGKVRGLHAFQLDSPESPTVSLHFLDHIYKNAGFGLFLVGYCNGLLCIGTPLLSPIIFNPSTGMYRESDCHSEIDSGSAYVMNIYYGFAFDDINDDYKIVRVRDYLSNNDDYVGMRRDAEVYSLKSNSWSLVERPSIEDSVKYMEHGVLIDNHLVHWMFQSIEC